MIIVFSHANNVEYEDITTCEAVSYMHLLDIYDGEVIIKNYEDIGGNAKITFIELSKRIRFYDSVDREFINKLGKDSRIMDSLLQQLDMMV